MFIEKFAYVEGIYGRKKTRVQGVVCQKIPPKQVLDKKTILPPTVLICLEKVKIECSYIYIIVKNGLNFS